MTITFPFAWPSCDSSSEQHLNVWMGLLPWIKVSVYRLNQGLLDFSFIQFACLRVLLHGNLGCILEFLSPGLSHINTWNWFKSLSMQLKVTWLPGKILSEPCCSVSVALGGALGGVGDGTCAPTDFSTNSRMQGIGLQPGQSQGQTAMGVAVAVQFLHQQWGMGLQPS